MDKNIQKAIEETLSGKRESYSVIVSAYMQKLYNKAFYITKDAESAKDIVQETFIEGYYRLSSLREHERAEGWFMRILKNKAINYINRNRFDYSEIENISIADNTSPEALCLADENLKELTDLLNDLSPALRETAMLYFLDSMSMEMIAKQTNTPLGTVKRRIHDARQRLKKEKNMKNCEKLTDSFITELSQKIERLENYYKIHGSRIGFDGAYSGVKELIKNLSDEDSIKEYSIKGITIALGYNRKKYADEALEIFRKYGKAEEASSLLLGLCWELNDFKEEIEYTLRKIIPELEKYPNGAEKDAAIAAHYFWIARYYHDLKDLERSDESADKAIELFKRSGKVDSYYANAISAKKANKILRNGIADYGIIVTAEQWAVKENNLYFCCEPGFSYETCNVRGYDNYVFLNAGWLGDRYFFPRTVPIEAGREEEMKDDRGSCLGVRKIVSVSDTVETPAGIFTNCVHIERIDEDNDTADIWYKDGVGIVKEIESSKPYNEKVLSAYEIKGGEGLLPLYVGNKWCYTTPGIDDAILEINEYVIEQRGIHKTYGDSVTVSAISYFGCTKPIDKMPGDERLTLVYVGQLCEKREYKKAQEILCNIIEISDNKDIRDSAESILKVIEEKLPLDELNWRFCPSSANISEIQIRDGNIKYYECMHCFNDLGPFGTRHEENRIFGAKPFRYLFMLCGTLWDDKWVSGYRDVIENVRCNQGMSLKISADSCGELETPAGIFKDTIHLVLDCEPFGDPEECKTFFYDATQCGIKEYWFARGIGIVRFKCTWGRHLESDLYLIEYDIAEAHGEMLPIYTGNRWRYEEKYLTEENYIARRDYKIISGKNGRYRLSDNQFFTWRGSIEEYEKWKSDTCPKFAE